MIYYRPTSWPSRNYMIYYRPNSYQVETKWSTINWPPKASRKEMNGNDIHKDKVYLHTFDLRPRFKLAFGILPSLSSSRSPLLLWWWSWLPMTRWQWMIQQITLLLSCWLPATFPQSLSQLVGCVPLPAVSNGTLPPPRFMIDIPRPGLVS